MKQATKIVVLNQRRRRWVYAPKAKIPKVPNPMKNTNLLIHGLLVSVYSSWAGNNTLRNHEVNICGEKEKPIIGAGRGGKHCGKKSAMGQIADSAVKPKRQKKEHTPYRPVAQMHDILSLEDIQRKCGIRKPIQGGKQ